VTAGAEPSSESGLKGLHDAAAHLREQSLGESCLAALEGHTNQQRIFPGRDGASAEQVHRFDAFDFRNAQATYRGNNVGENCAVGKNQREVALHSGETGQRPGAQSSTSGAVAGVERLQFELGEKNVLAELHSLSAAAAELASKSNGSACERNRCHA